MGKNNDAQETLIWKLNSPGLIEEVGNCCTEAGALLVPLTMLQRMLKALAEYAAEKNDPELNIHMLRMGLYDVPARIIDKTILGEVEKLKEGKELWLKRLRNAV